MTATDRTRERVQAAADAPVVQNGQPTVFDLLTQLQPQIKRALPRTMSADRFTRLVMTTLRTSPGLMACNPQSLMAACMLSAQLGLEPGPLGHAYFVPFKREVTFVLGYKGMIRLARNSGEIASIEAREVCAGDLFEYEFGLDAKLRHIPTESERGAPTHYWGLAKFKDGGHYFTVLTKSEIDKFRARSRAGQNGPWVTDYSQMAMKTVIRRMAPYLPLTVEAARGVEADEGLVTTLPLDTGDGDVDVQVEHDEATLIDGEVVEDTLDETPEGQQTIGEA